MANKTYKLTLDVSTNNTGIALTDDKGYVVVSYEIKTKHQEPDFGMRMALDMGIIEQELTGNGKAIQYIMGAHKDYSELVDRELLKATDKELKPLEIDILKNPKGHSEKVLTELRAKAVEIRKKAWAEMEKINLLVVIETNKIEKGQDVKQKLDLYAGMYMGYLTYILNTVAPYFNRHYKLSSPTEWRMKAYGYEPTTKEAKELAIKKANEILKAQKQDREVAGHDEAEAIIIGTVAEYLRDIATQYTQKQDRAKNISRLRGQLPRVEGLVKKYQMIEKERAKVGKALTKADQKVLDTNLQKVSTIKAEIKTLTKGVHNGTKTK